MGLQTTREKKEKMNKGFNSDLNVEFDLPIEDINKLLKKYKKIKKYQKSSLFAVKTMDGTEKIISKMVQELEDNPL